MTENGKILGLPEATFKRIVCVLAVVVGCCVSLHFCKRSINVDFDANRNKCVIQYVTPKTK